MKTSIKRLPSGFPELNVVFVYFYFFIFSYFSFDLLNMKRHSVLLTFWNKIFILICKCAFPFLVTWGVVKFCERKKYFKIALCIFQIFWPNVDLSVIEFDQFWDLHRQVLRLVVSEWYSYQIICYCFQKWEYSVPADILWISYSNKCSKIHREATAIEIFYSNVACEKEWFLKSSSNNKSNTEFQVPK